MTTLAVTKEQNKYPKKLRIVLLAACILSVLLGIFSSQKATPTPSLSQDVEETESEKSSPKPNNDQIVNYFLNMTTTNEYPEIHKWADDVVAIGVHVNFPQQNHFHSTPDVDSCVNPLIDELNSLDLPVKFERTRWFPENIRINITDKKAVDEHLKIYNKYKPDSPLHEEAVGLADYFSKPDGSLNFSQILVADDVLDDRERCWTIYHEVMHSLGFPGHSGYDLQSVSITGFPFINYRNFSFSKFDVLLIKMLYSDRLNSLATRSEVKEFFQKNPPTNIPEYP